LIKVAMVRIAAALRAGPLARLLLQVHDELVVECPAEEAEEVVRLLRLEMEGAAQLSVPLVVDVGIGDTWLDAKAGP
jgi:DNA polymerase I-like protein with 3'-5' exonuclease and polymerase domains